MLNACMGVVVTDVHCMLAYLCLGYVYLLIYDSLCWVRF